MRRASSFFKMTVLILSIVFLFFGCAKQTTLVHKSYTENQSGYPFLPDNEIHNIILFIGDGMGLGQITAGRLHAYGTKRRLNLEKMPVTGYIYTHPIDTLITDSAAGATALASGFKTHNGMIAMLPDNSRVQTILEAAQKLGKSTGLVATSSITHATPACFASHVPARTLQPEIARQLVDSDVDVLMGGGRHFFVPQKISGSMRKDNLDLLKLARKRGYQTVESAAELSQVTDGSVLGLFEMDALTHAAGEPTLAEMTRKSLEILSQNERGFFLMAEGSQIDWGGHENNADYVIRELLAFDEAVKAGLDFALQDKHTLVIVTADHETGGLAINGGNFDGKTLDISWTTTHHTGVPVPVFAFGPHSLYFTGVHDNTDIPKIFAKLWNISEFPKQIITDPQLSRENSR